MAKYPENVIHVTGFGPFRGFTKSNPSWEAVSILPDHIVHNDQVIPIVKHEVPVTYAAVDEKVKELWSYNPKVILISKIFSGKFKLKHVMIDFCSLLFIAVSITKQIKFAWNEMHSMGISVNLITIISSSTAVMLHCRMEGMNANNCARH